MKDGKLSTTTYNRYDPALNYDRAVFVPDRTLQSAEMNELQSMQQARLRGIADALFSDGAIIRDARCYVEAGQARLESGALYIEGAVRGVAPATLTVPTTGTVFVGVYLNTETITELEDPNLRNPAIGTRGYQEAGAWRIRMQLKWGVQGDGSEGDFYPVWEIANGVVRQREAAPQLGAITQAIARYDRDSSGGTYVVRGLETVMLDDTPDGRQAYSVASGAARVNGNAVELSADSRVEVKTLPDLALVDAEPKLSSTDARQSITFDRWPADVASVQVRIIRRKTADVVHGGFNGAADPLPDNAVLKIERIQQGAKTFQETVDFIFSAGQIDWSPGGDEPATGSTYKVTYQYKTTVTPDNLTAYGYDVEGALPGTLIESTYRHKLRRIDLLVLNDQGAISMVRGVPDAWAPRAPQLPSGQLALAHIHQRWDDGRRVELAAVRVVPMQTLVDYDTRLDNINRQMAELRLAVNVAGRYSGVKAGQFADPMLDDSMRDAGAAQTGAIEGGWLQLPGGVDASPLAALAAPRAMTHTLQSIVAQPLRTSAMHINATAQAAAQKPSTLTITPAADRWETGGFSFKSTVINAVETPSQRMNPAVPTPGYNLPLNTKRIREEAEMEVLAREKGKRRTMRELDLKLDITGMKRGERVASVTIGGLAAVFSTPPGQPTEAAEDGLLTVASRIPAGVPTGTAPVIVKGSLGTVAEAAYSGTVVVVVQGMYRNANRNGESSLSSHRVEIEL